MLSIERIENKNLKNKPDSEGLGFGNIFTDNMFVMDYSTEKGWHSPRVVPYGPICLDPSTMVFHYGQEVFEGMKAYKNNGQILLFRPEMNAKRLNQSNRRLCIPEIPVEDIIQAVEHLVKIEQDWIPEGKGNALYIRPFIIATDPFLGVRPSATYKFMIILSPVGAYYKEGINPVKIWVEENYVRATPGGVGEAKAGGNYAASLSAQMEAKTKGYTQVLWLDGVERKYIEEVGTMNVFFKCDGQVITPQLSGSILPGVTRDSVLKMLAHLGIPVNQRRITIDELIEYADKGLLEEGFGTGTAAVISPIGELHYKGKSIVINNGQTGAVAQKLYDELTAIQMGEKPDIFDWTLKI